MGKLLSVLEKYKLIEKESEKMSSPENPDIYSPNTISANGEDQMAAVPSEKNDAENDREEVNFSDTPPPADTSSAVSYDKKMSLEEIYAFYQLNLHPATETVFVLENLINALPSELPEYVKKTTLNNILAASSMDLSKLLEDGRSRYHHLNEFIEDYTLQNTDAITSLKQEIDKLSAIINSYHQQIKLKESMVNEEIVLIKQEKERLQSIFNFFEK